MFGDALKRLLNAHTQHQAQQQVQPQQQPLRVISAQQMQPSGASREDQWTAGQEAQPVNYNNGQATLHSAFLQARPQMVGRMDLIAPENYPNEQLYNPITGDSSTEFKRQGVQYTHPQDRFSNQRLRNILGR